jgi:hypothetical protein
MEAVEDLDETFVSDRDGKGGPTEVQGLSRYIRWKARRAAQLKRSTLEELPGAEFFPSVIERGAKVPACMGNPIVHQVIVFGHDRS